MCILYNPDTQKFAKIIKANNNYKTSSVNSLKEATNIDDDLANTLVKKCSKKLKGFKKFSTEYFANLKTETSSELDELTDDCSQKTPRRAFATEERVAIYVRDRGICGICGRFVPPNEYSIDHIIPISHGGSYDQENLQCCCKKCNQLKADTLPEDFFQRILEIIEFQIEKDNKNIKKGLKKIVKKRK